MKKRVWVFLLALGMVLAAGCSFSSQKEGAEGTDPSQSYGGNFYGYAPYEEGILLDLGAVWNYDAAAKQLKAFCSQPDCAHEYDGKDSPEEAACPAASLGLRAFTFAVYEGKLWYVLENEGVWEFWTADLSNENHIKQFEAELGAVPPYVEMYSTVLFCDGYCYLVQGMLSQDNDWGKGPKRLVAIRLKDGKVEALTEWIEEGSRTLLSLVGVHGDQVYYALMEDEEMGQTVQKLYCLSHKSGKVKLIAKGNQGELSAQMDQEWLLYRFRDDNGAQKTFVTALDTGDTQEIFVGDQEEGGIWLSHRKVLREHYNWKTKTSSYVILDLESGKMQETGTYDRIYNKWMRFGGDWFCVAEKTREEKAAAGPFAGPEEYKNYYYISEQDFLDGKEMTQVKPETVAQK